MQFQFNGVYYQFSNTQLIVAAFVIVLLIVIAVAAWTERRKARTQVLRNRFGSEYDREVIEQHDSSSQAESKLADRQTRVDKLEIRDLGVTERERFMTEWYTVQSRFVDHPRAAITEAGDLIDALLDARGYPQAGFEQRAADVSVGYPRVMDDYRAAHGIAVRLGRVEATTEELRTAMIKYRTVFDEIVQPRTARNEIVAA